MTSERRKEHKEKKKKQKERMIRALQEYERQAWLQCQIIERNEPQEAAEKVEQMQWAFWKGGY